MRFVVMTVSTYVVLLVLLLYSIGNEGKKKKSAFTFEALMSGMNAKEKEMFKEELNKEVKKFRAAQKQHQNKKKPAAIKKFVKKRKLKEKLPKFLPGICDPICAHQCVHGCDFRCCIPDYQQTHKIPRPPPMVVLPGSCSPTCSPTCRPLCTEKCCSGGPGGMFQSSKDLVTLDTRTCPAGCSPACMPRCVISCCVSSMPKVHEMQDLEPVIHKSISMKNTGDVEKKAEETTPQVNHIVDAPRLQEIVLQMRNNVKNHLGAKLLPGVVSQMLHNSEAQVSTPDKHPKSHNLRNSQVVQGPLLESQTALTPSHVPKTYLIENMKCSPVCPEYCLPLCRTGCCYSSKREYTRIPVIFRQNMIGQGTRIQPLKVPLQLHYSSVITPAKSLPLLPKQNCPQVCFASCKPNCEVRCCRLKSRMMNRLNLLSHARQFFHSTLRPFDYQMNRIIKNTPFHTTRDLLSSRYFPQIISRENAALMHPMVRIASAHKRVQSRNPTIGGYVNNVETIHALSKDMISKPEPFTERNPAQRDNVPKHNGKKKDKKNETSSFNSLDDMQIKTQILSPSLDSRYILRTTETDISNRTPNPMYEEGNVEVGLAVQSQRSSTSNLNGGLKTASASTVHETSGEMTPKPTPKALVDITQTSSVTKKAKKSTIPTVKTKIEANEHRKFVGKDSVKSQKKKKITCHHACLEKCTPNCDKPCCNREIVYKSFHSTQKRSKIQNQLQFLK